MITIHYDFTDGSEISYIEGMEKKDNFNTHCLSFFSFETDVDVTVLKKDGSMIIKSELLGSSVYTNKNIRVAHNIERMLLANAFKFKK